MLRLSFLPGLTPADLQGFLALIRDAFLQESGSSDVVDLMWQNEIEHISVLRSQRIPGQQCGRGHDDAPGFQRRSARPHGGDDRTRTLKTSPSIRSAAAAAAVQDLGRRMESRPRSLALWRMKDEDDERPWRLCSKASAASRSSRISSTPWSSSSGSKTGPVRLLKLSSIWLSITTEVDPGGPLLQRPSPLGRDRRAGPRPSSVPAGEIVLLGGLEERFKRQASPEALRAVARPGDPLGFSPVLRLCFDRIGPSTLAFVGDLYESSEDRAFRSQAEAFFARLGRSDPACLAGLADPGKPALARAILSALAGQSDRRVLPHLAAFSRPSGCVHPPGGGAGRSRLPGPRGPANPGRIPR